nr:hypothetical protein Iba_chr09cCG11340 [Ipomoea batatas]
MVREGGGKTLRPSICCRENAGELLPHRHRTLVAVHRCFVGEGEEGERMLLVYPASPVVGPAVADHHRLCRSRGDPRPPLLSTIVPCGKGRAATLHRCCCRWPNGEGRTAEPCRCLAPCTAGEGEELLPLSLEKKTTPRAGEGGHTVVEAEGGINLRHRRGRTAIAELLTPSQVVNPMKLAGWDDGSLVLCRRLATSKLCHGCHVMPPGRRDDAVAAPCSVKLPSTGEGKQGCRSPHCGYHPSMSLWPRVAREVEAEAERMEVRCRL